MKTRMKPVTKENLPQRFSKEYIEERVKKDECWIWNRSIGTAGYGQLGTWPYNAHVVSYVLWKGDLSEGELVRHLCHNGRCCNPSHLEKGSHKDNWKDSEEVHRESNRRRRGRPARNRIPIEVDGEIFSSKVEAIKTLRRGAKYIEKHGKPLQVAT